MPTVNKQITIGLELECVEFNPGYNAFARQYGFRLFHDATIQDDNGNQATLGGELITPPFTFNVRFAEDGENFLATPADDAHDLVNSLCACARRVNQTCGR
jgi:hypothetical protein